MDGVGEYQPEKSCLFLPFQSSVFSSLPHVSAFTPNTPTLGAPTAFPQGVLVLDVPGGSPADVAGIKPSRRDTQTGRLVLGDIIIAIQGVSPAAQKKPRTV